MQMPSQAYLLADQPSELEQLRKECEAELEEPGRWGTTFTLLQCWGQRPGKPVRASAYPVDAIGRVVRENGFGAVSRPRASPRLCPEVRPG